MAKWVTGTAIFLLTASAVIVPVAPASPDDGAAPPASHIAAPVANATPSPAEVPLRQSLFDPARHIRVSEVRAGMKGYGLSVFKGTKVERFEVEVLSVLKNFNPKYDVVLISCRGANLEHTGAIAGMSGSPIYLTDDKGRDRMIGAFAYGWPLTKDPIAGVQPIEYMLTLPTDPPIDPPAAVPAVEVADASLAWSFRDAAAGWARLATPAGVPDVADSTARLTGTGSAPRLRPLASPLMAAGLSPRLLDQLAPAFRAQGLELLQAGAGGSGVAEEPPAPLEPGSVLAVPLITGDMELTALGTCTEVLGDRVFGFGHSFNNEGPVTLPMGSGRVNGIVATLSTSFKLGSLTKPRGQLTADQTVGVAGRIGAVPPMVPIEIKVIRAGKAGPPDERTFRFGGARHARFTPLICGVAMMAALSGSSDLPQNNTVDYTLDLEFENGQTVRVVDTLANAQAIELFQAIGTSLAAAADNPFERVLVRGVKGVVNVSPEVRQGQIVDVNVPRSKYHPGETLSAFVTYKPFRAAETTLPIELDLPKDLPQGTYQLVISDADRYVQDEMLTKPFRFTAEKIGDVFDVLKDLAGIRHNAVYVRLLRQADGVAVGRTALAQLPSSRRQILMASGRSNTTPFVSSTVKIIPTDRVMTGSAEFQITIETKSRVEGGSPPGPTSRPNAAAPAKADDRKPPRPAPRESPPDGLK